MSKTPRGLDEAPRDYRLADTVLQIRKIGNSVGVILPKELLARLNLKEGDKLFPIEQPGGGLILTPHDPDFEKAMEVARRGMKRYHNALAELAK
jgi:putative addiction module antidote